MGRKPDLSIIGNIYNNLKVIDITDEYNSYNRRLYRCTCRLCGKEKLATRSNLLRSEVKDCGNHHMYNDITGKKFGRLIALQPIEKKEKTTDRCKKWLCVCDCGNTCNVSYHKLITGNTKSCGCLQREEAKKLYKDGTAPCKIEHPERLRETNTSGVTGVWFDSNRNMWCAEIMFQKKKYFLGRYKEKKEAIAARKEGEKEIFEKYLLKIK